MEIAIVITVVATAALFGAWRIWRTLQVSQGKGQGHACGKCPAATTHNG